MQEKQSFGRYIAKKRKSMGMTQEVLADKIGVSKSAVAKWETDGGLPDRDNLKLLAENLNLSVDRLHKVISEGNNVSLKKNPDITPDVIDALESHGYTVIAPGER